MKILSIGKKIQHANLEIISFEFSALEKIDEITLYDYIIITGGDGAVRRAIKQLLKLNQTLPPFILNAKGSFNVVAKLHRAPKLTKVLDKLAENKPLNLNKQSIYALNHEVFLFSAGNMNDLQHIFFSEIIRFGFLKKGMLKYLVSAFLLLPVHIMTLPFMLMSNKRFFIFAPARFIKKLGSFYGQVPEIKIDLDNYYNLVELDGDVVTIEEAIFNIRTVGEMQVVTKLT